MSEWTHTKPPYRLAVQAWFDNGSVRTGMLRDGYFFFSDCAHPLQNAIVNPDHICAWRLV